MNAVAVGPGRDTQRQPAAGQGLLLTVAGLLLVPAVATTVMRLLPPTDDATALAAAFIAYGVIPYEVALVCLLVALVRARRRLVLAILSGLVAILTALHLAWLGPLFVADQRVAGSAPFTVMSLNLYNGKADTATVAATAEQADIAVLLEVTPAAIQALRAQGWDERFPYTVGAPVYGVGGTAVYSRFPLGRGTELGGTAFQQWDVMVEVPELGPVRLLAVHPCNPFCGGNQWHAEHQQLRRSAATGVDAPTIMAGDFNAVPDHGPMQRLRRIGLRSASDVIGAGWLPTYPSGRTIPPLLPIDHVLVNDRLTATSVTTFGVAGTDHRGILATLAGA